MDKCKRRIISASLSAVIMAILLTAWFLVKQTSASASLCQRPPHDAENCHMSRFYFNTFTENCEPGNTCNVKAHKSYADCMRSCAL